MSDQDVFPPPKHFAEQAHIRSMAEYERLYRAATDDPEEFWAEQAEQLHWFTKWSKVLDWSRPPYAKWFVGGKLNASYNCLDRHLATRGDKTAVIWEGEPGEIRRFTYRELHAEVSKFANVLKSLGVQTGDRVAIYLPLIPEAVVAMLACARVGAAHSVVFGGFSA